MATVRPHLIACTISVKSSVIKIISDASRATSVPAIPMENPTSANFKAGASLVPSPVTATTSPLFRKVSTRIRLSSGDDRANTRNCGTIFLRSAGDNFLNLGPSINAYSLSKSSGVKMWHSFEMAFAVFKLSPVTIRTVTPACLHFNTAWATPGFNGSWIPTNASKTYFLSISLALALTLTKASTSTSSGFSRYFKSSGGQDEIPTKSRWAKAIARKASLAYSSILVKTSSRLVLSNLIKSPSVFNS